MPLTLLGIPFCPVCKKQEGLQSLLIDVYGDVTWGCSICGTTFKHYHNFDWRQETGQIRKVRPEDDDYIMKRYERRYNP